MTTRRKVFVINAPAAAGANVVKSTEMNLLTIVDGGKLVVACNLAGYSAAAIAPAAEVRQVVKFTIPTVVASKKYVLTREPNPLYMACRDANFYLNTKRYHYVAPATLGTGADEIHNLIDALVAKVNADSSNMAAATATDTNTTLTITEDAGYGLSPSYPGPFVWTLTEVPSSGYTLTPGKAAVGDGNVMLAQQAVWTIDKTMLRSGQLEYNFDNTKPIAGKTYDTVIITEEYGMNDHFAAKPNIKNEILLYIDTTDANNAQNFQYALGVPGVTQAV